MIEYIHPYISNQLYEGLPSWSKILNISVNAVTAAILYHLHHNVFTLGLITGFFLNKQISNISKALDIFYQIPRSWPMRTCQGLMVCMYWPQLLVISTFHYSARLGCSINNLLVKPPRS